MSFGCKSAPTKGNPADACSFVSDDEIKDATGFAVKDKASRTMDYWYTRNGAEVDGKDVACEYNIEKHSMGTDSYSNVSVVVIPVDQLSASAEPNTDKSLPPPEPVSGIGDQAFWLKTGDGTGNLYVRKGSLAIYIGVGLLKQFMPKPGIEIGKQLALDAVARF